MVTLLQRIYYVIIFLHRYINPSLNNIFIIIPEYYTVSRTSSSSILGFYMNEELAF